MHIHSIQMENTLQENSQDCFSLISTLQTGVVQHLLQHLFFLTIDTFHMN